jgi:hypothetical protein
MSFSPNLFLSNVKAKAGLARPNRFEVVLPIPTYVGNFVSTSVLDQIINLPNSIFTTISEAFNRGIENDPQSVSSSPSISRYLALQCETAELPGKSILTTDVKIYGPTYKVPYQTQYDEITLTFLCTNEFYERKLFDRWLECIMPSDTNNLRFPKDDETRYMTNLKIVQYDDFIKQIYAIELVDAFPVGIAPQQVNWADDGFHRVSVRFAYQKYKVVYKGQYNIAQAVAAVFGSYGERVLQTYGDRFAQDLFV